MNETLQTRPMVAIIGRPNVGKSSIFNRLAGRRIAIVHEEAGITRDRIVCAIRHGDCCYDIVDTGGLDDAENLINKRPSSGGNVEALVHRQVETALQDATAVIFVVDAQAGIMPADEKVAGLLRKSSLPVLLAANKTDNEQVELGAAEFEKFGFPVFPLSALHYRGFDNLTATLKNILPAGTVDNISRLHIALVGRPNVGKSLLVNRLLRTERVIVSSEPGTTRDSIHVPMDVKAGPQQQGYILIDTAGLRQGKKIRQPVDSFSQLRTERSIASADVVGLVIDAEQGPTAFDKTIAAQILEKHKGCVLIVNKWDLAQTKSTQFYCSALRRALPFMDFVPVVCVSAATGFNINHIIDAVNYVAGENKKKISTGILNRAIKIACRDFQPPLVRGGRLKIYYATQTSIHPITFLIFVNDPDKVNLNYEKYLTAALRRSFGFEGAPIVLNFRKRESLRRAESGKSK